MIYHHDNRYPFPGANVMFETPIPANSFIPKQWNLDGSSVVGSGQLNSSNSNFITAGIAPGDALFVISGTPPITVATTVFAVGSPTVLMINWMADQDYTNILFKVGEAAQHTFRTLVNIIRDRDVTSYTLHWQRLWTEALFSDFNPDETGEVYIIDPEEERKLNGKNRVNGILLIRPERE